MQEVLFSIQRLFLIVENLVGKYGKGQDFVRKRQSCHYEQKIRTAGVHTSSGGALMVYDEEDTFSCPNCEFEACTEVDCKSCKLVSINRYITK